MTSDFGSLIEELETVALAQREQRYPIANVGPATVSDVDGLRELLGFVRCAVVPHLDRARGRALPALRSARASEGRGVSARWLMYLTAGV
jgi:hypothetical protein